MPVLAIGDVFGISGRREELLAALAEAERDAVAQPGCVRCAQQRGCRRPDPWRSP